MNLKDGEVICNQCKGTGHPNNNKVNYNSRSLFPVPHVCDKCNGVGKLDWIEVIVGKKHLRKITSQWKVEMDNDVQVLYGSDMEKEIIDKLGEEISKKIDKDILEGIINGSKSGTWGSGVS